MNRGCISSGDIQCGDCYRAINYLERYLAIEEAEGVMLRLCLDCAMRQGYAHYKPEKGERIPTFFPESKIEP